MTLTAISNTLEILSPWQPAIAGATIVGKIGWRTYQQSSLKKEIKQLDKRIRTLRSILQSQGTPQEIKEKIDITALVAEKSEKQNQLNAFRIAICQIPCLFWTHPGSNIWASSHQILNRGIQVSKTLQPANQNLETRSLIIGTIAGMAIIAGGISSCLQLTETIDPDNQFHRLLMKGALAINIYESGCVALRILDSESARKALQKASWIGQAILCQSLVLGCPGAETAEHLPSPTMIQPSADEEECQAIPAESIGVKIRRITSAAQIFLCKTLLLGIPRTGTIA